MKKQLFSYLLATLLLISISGFGQHKDYPIKKVHGVEYYQYTVQVSEGLFAIGRKFEVSPDEINKANPEIKNGLKVGQQILIPVQKKAADSQKTVSENNTKTEFIEHKVEKKQTIFAICHKYNITQDDLKKYNPEIENGLQEDMILRIPKQVKVDKKKDAEKINSEKQEKASAKQQKQEQKNIVIHEVKQDETLYSISRKYKVEVADIIELNPGSSAKLTAGTELKIPRKHGSSMTQKKEPVVKNEKDSGVKTSKQEFDITRLFDTSIFKKSAEKNKVIRIGFLLPFMLDQDKKDASIDRFVDFYEGALLAINEAKKKGISFEIYTYDTEKSEEKLLEVLTNSELKTMDLIIGPAFANQVPLVGDFAKENRINTLIPFTSKVSDIDTNPYLFQFNPGSDTQLNFATELFTGKYKNINIVFAELPGISSMDEGKQWAQDLQKELKKANKSFSKLELTTSDVADFGSVFKAGIKNLVIFNTDKYAYVSPFIESLTNTGGDYKVVLFEQYSWKNQSEKLPAGICLSPFMATQNADKVSSFNKEFIYHFGKSVSKESPRFDLLGYDLSNYFISLIYKYRSKFTDKIGNFNFTDGLQSKPLFERISNGSGFVNQRVYLIED